MTTVDTTTAARRNLFVRLLGRHPLAAITVRPVLAFAALLTLTAVVGQLAGRESLHIAWTIPVAAAIVLTLGWAVRTIQTAQGRSAAAVLAFVVVVTFGLALAALFGILIVEALTGGSPCAA